MTKALSILLLLACALPAAARSQQEDAARLKLPEASRWLSFVRLVEARWDMRTRIPPEGEQERNELFTRCTRDAWYLSRPELLAPDAACERLVQRDAPKRSRPTGDQVRRFRSLDASAGEDGFRACVAAAEKAPGLLAHCAAALHPGAASMASLDDEARFQSWFGACKKAILGDPEKEEADPRLEAHARHCLRTLPTFYEVRWMKKLSEYWTPDEQKRLYLRSRQLGRD